MPAKPPPTDFLGAGWAFPIGPQGGRLAMLADDDLIRQSILLILQTSKGERVMEPQFGCDLKQMVFEANNDQAVHLAEYAVRDALRRWEPRIRVADVTAKADPTTPGRLLIGVDYVIRSLNSPRNLVFPFYLGTPQ